MSTLRRAILAAIENDGPMASGLPALGLSAVARLYETAMVRRALWYAADRRRSRRLPCRVVSIGNITVGGTGKTPMTLRLAGEFADAGIPTVIVSRGYRGKAEAEGGVVSDGETLFMDAATAGDEPFMMAETLMAAQRRVPVVVGRDRYAAGMTAVRRFGAKILLLDDAFQHLRLARDLDLLLLDARAPFGNGRVLPRGPLREPLSALKRADAVILTRCDPGVSPAAREIERGVLGCPLFRTVHRPFVRKIVRYSAPVPDEPGPVRPEAIDRRPAVFAFSGIARNETFISTAQSLGFQVTGQAGFPDHYAYTPSDLTDLSAAAVSSGAGGIVTTEKDYARMDRGFTWPLDLFVIGIEMDFGAENPAFRRFVRSRLGIPESPPVNPSAPA